MAGLQRLGAFGAGLWPEHQRARRRFDHPRQYVARFPDARRHDHRPVVVVHAEVQQRLLRLARQVQHARRRREDAADGWWRRDDLLEHRVRRAGQRRDAALHFWRHRDAEDCACDLHAHDLRSTQRAKPRRHRPSIRGRHDRESLGNGSADAIWADRIRCEVSTARRKGSISIRRPSSSCRQSRAASSPARAIITAPIRCSSSFGKIPTIRAADGACLARFPLPTPIRTRLAMW